MYTNIFFTDKGHVYKTLDGQIYDSVSRVFDKFKTKFDAEKNSLRMVLKELVDPVTYSLNSKKYGWNSWKLVEALRPLVDESQLLEKQKILLDQWEETRVKGSGMGTIVHKRKEAKSYDRGYEINPYNGKTYDVITFDKDPNYDNQTVCPDLYQVEDGFYAEMIVYNPFYEFCGTADKVFIETKKGKRYIDIDDWKSDKEITIEGFRGKRLKHPVSHMQDCKYNVYTLKLSMYMWMFEQFGFTPRDIGFTHLTIDKDTGEIFDSKLYKTTYKKMEVEKMLEAYEEDKY